jgi:hypothetical protein
MARITGVRNYPHPNPRELERQQTAAEHTRQQRAAEQVRQQLFQQEQRRVFMTPDMVTHADTHYRAALATEEATPPRTGLRADWQVIRAEETRRRLQGAIPATQEAIPATHNTDFGIGEGFPLTTPKKKTKTNQSWNELFGGAKK